MPRGQPDYGLTAQTVLAAGIADPGEAAARLGSINVYDRRGWTLWMDNFEAPALKWEAASFGGGIVPVLDSSRAWTGAQSVKLACPAAGAPISQLYRCFPLARLGKVGAEFWIQTNQVVGSYIRFLLGIYDGVNLSSAEMEYYPQLGTIRLATSVGWILVASDIYMTQAGQYFLPIKLVVDMDTEQFIRLLVGEREIDISSYLMFNAGATVFRVIGVILALYGVAGGATEAYIDNFILTVSEP